MINVFQMLVKLFVSLWWCALLSLIDPPVEASSITNPLRHDGDISKVVPGYFDVKRKKDYFNMTPNALKDLPFISHNHPDPACNVGFHLAWSTTVGSAVFASPVSFPDRDGKRQLFLSTFFESVEALSNDGYKLPGWPLNFESSTFQGSPMLYDIDGDGQNDVGMVDKNGHLYWVRMGEFGQYLEDYHIQVPKLKIKKDWASGLDPNFVDSYIMNSMFDHDGAGMYRRWNEPKAKLFSNKEEKKEAYSSGKVKPDVLAALGRKNSLVNEKSAKKGRGNDNRAGGSTGKFEAEPLSTAFDGLDGRVQEAFAAAKSAAEAAARAEAEQARAHDGGESPPMHGRRLQAVNDVEEEEEQARHPDTHRRGEEDPHVQHEERERRDGEHREGHEHEQPHPAEHTETHSEPVHRDDQHHAERHDKHDEEHHEEHHEEHGSLRESAHHEGAHERELHEERGHVDAVGSHKEAHETGHGESDHEGGHERERERFHGHEREHEQEHEQEHVASGQADHEGAHGGKSGADHAHLEAHDIPAAALKDDPQERTHGAHHEDEKEEKEEKEDEAWHPNVNVKITDHRGKGLTHHDDQMARHFSDSHHEHEHEHAEGGTHAGADGDASHESNGEDKAAIEANRKEIEAAVLAKIADMDVPDPSLGDRPEGEKGDDYISAAGATSYGSGRGRSRGMDDGMRGYYGGYRHGGMFNDTDYVFVDAHVLGSPVLADINNDGHVEVIIAVSYYFDKEEYEGKTVDFDPSMYVAGGIVCWDLQEQDWTWMVHLDLTTDKSKFKALVYSTPTVADLDGDGRMEIIVGTSMGLLYMLDGDNGFVKRFFPMQFHQIQAQVAVADVMGGPNLEMIVADMGGTLAVVDFDGEVLWDVLTSGTLPHTPTIGDVDGDGNLDIVVVAATEKGESHLWVVRADTGKPLDGYPKALPHGAKASASVLLVDLHHYDLLGYAVKTEKQKYEDPSLPPWLSQDGNKRSLGLHIIVPSFDGHIYVIEGRLGCAERIDIGEHIYSVPLIDDITDDGFLDLVVGTLNGQLHVLETKIPYHAMNSWPSFPKGRLNGFTHGLMGVSVPLVERRLLARADIINRGQRRVTVTPKHHDHDHDHDKNDTSHHDHKNEADKGVSITHGLYVTFDLWDVRPITPELTTGRKYKVVFTRGTNKLEPLATHEYVSPGRYTIELPLHPPETFLLVIGMTNEHGQYFEDTVPVTLSTRFYVWIKFMVLVPAILLYGPLLLMKRKIKQL